ncbi:glycoside hydrolase family 72 /Carbohydrate-binding module family 43 [Melampsora larici-populina 98AG31]|uniref:1,3-beta-glucanosyltransferase n=1 Tax=Melampsora larici-populina (strain 98AG31 / pathotype 3-4-7) TaxID=747676 RepID=F4R4E2_MELLP|nr:glycoside hydrolase family 72 /Carbohydrate-binding module family 43 [Melampsora larici-populina 98AG31]EGG13017.1 glycoside hydrolase family 72 /Carbohydrate-binding module family 43 [Melampsora larici-populina 98AG31]
MQKYIILSFWAFVSLLSSVSSKTLPIQRIGRYLYDSQGVRFYIKGVAFQKPGALNPSSAEHSANGGFPEPSNFIDSLADNTACRSAIKNFKELAINTIRVYSIDPTKNHTECMNALDEAGIYVIADTSLPLNGSINRASPSWDVSLMEKYFRQIDNLKSFPNLLAFNIGNEIVTKEENMNAAPFIKASVRETKAYLKRVNSSALVSYASTDGGAYTIDLAYYLTCGEPEISLDLYGINVYRWCGDSNFQSSGYAAFNDNFKALPTALYMSEFGCNTAPKRLWTEVLAIYSPLMSDVWSGGSAFSYFPSLQGFGLTTTSNGSDPQTNDDFKRLSQQYSKAKGPNSPTIATAKNMNTTSICKNTQGRVRLATDANLPPTPNLDACTCVDNTVFSCQVKPDRSPAIIGELLDFACGQLGGDGIYKVGKGCDAIASKLTTRVKDPPGILSTCSPQTKLNYALSQYYRSQGSSALSCDFYGNATIENEKDKPKSGTEIEQAIARCFQAHSPTLNRTLTPQPSSATSGKSSTGANPRIIGGKQISSSREGAKISSANHDGESFSDTKNVYWYELINKLCPCPRCHEANLYNFFGVGGSFCLWNAHNMSCCIPTLA